MKRSYLEYGLALLGLRFALDVAYVGFVSPAFSDHFLLPMPLDVSLVRYVLSLLVYFAAVVVASPEKARVSNLFFLIALAFVFAPLTTLWGLDAERPLLPVATTLFSLVVVRVVTVGRVGRRLRVPTIREGRDIAILGSLVLVVAAIGWSVASGAASRMSLSLADIYLNRGDLSALNDIALMAYVNQWAFKIFSIMLFALALTRGRYGLALLLVALQVYFFGITARRMILFLPILTAGVWYFYSRGYQLSRLAVGMGSAIVAALLLTLNFDLSTVGSIAIRRAFFVPASATFEWFAFFGERPVVLWSDSLLSGLIDSPYNGRRLPLILGDHMASGRGISANNGFVSSGFAHAGFLGVLLYSVLFGLFCRACDHVASNERQLILVAAVLVGPVRTAWADSDLLTAFLTHGLAVGLVVVWVYSGTVQWQRRRAQPLTRSTTHATAPSTGTA